MPTLKKEATCDSNLLRLTKVLSWMCLSDTPSMEAVLILNHATKYQPAMQTSMRTKWFNLDRFKKALLQNA